MLDKDWYSVNKMLVTSNIINVELFKLNKLAVSVDVHCFLLSL